MRAKKSKTPKKQGQTNKTNEDSLASFLLQKHLRIEAKGERTAQTAKVLETILTGTDEDLQNILESWMRSFAPQGEPEAVQSIVRGWGPSNTKHLLSRLLVFVGSDKAGWTYPWIRAIMKVGVNLGVETIGQLNASLGNESTSPLGQILRLEGRFEAFDS